MSESVIYQKIYELRGQKVMLDYDLAELYEVPTKALNQAVKRNYKRFEMNLVIVRAFIVLRQFALTYKDLERQIQDIWLTVGNQDEQLKRINAAIEGLLNGKMEKQSWEGRDRIGFETP